MSDTLQIVVNGQTVDIFVPRDQDVVPQREIFERIQRLVLSILSTYEPWLKTLPAPPVGYAREFAKSNALGNIQGIPPPLYAVCWQGSQMFVSGDRSRLCDFPEIPGKFCELTYGSGKSIVMLNSAVLRLVSEHILKEKVVVDEAMTDLYPFHDLSRWFPELSSLVENSAFAHGDGLDDVDWHSGCTFTCMYPEMMVLQIQDAVLHLQ